MKLFRKTRFYEDPRMAYPSPIGDLADEAINAYEENVRSMENLFRKLETNAEGELCAAARYKPDLLI